MENTAPTTAASFQPDDQSQRILQLLTFVLTNRCRNKTLRQFVQKESK